MNRQLTVSQLAAYLKGVFDDEELLHDITLSGEVADISFSDKHTFLSLADGNTSIRCVHFYSRDAIEKGAKLALRGKVDFYAGRGSVSFNYSEFYSLGSGDKNEKLRERTERLRKLGYFENRPKLPRYITSVAVVTSPDGAAIRDFNRVTRDIAPYVRIYVYPVKVQGDGAAAQMTDAVRRLRTSGVDAIVLCRGGGSDEDLDCFNDELLATAVAKSRIPVISAVGHEIDNTLCDFCAGTRAGTPSIAGQIVGAHARALTEDLCDAMHDIQSSVALKFAGASLALGRLGTAVTRGISTRLTAYDRAVEHEARRGFYAVRKQYEKRVESLRELTLRLGAAMERRFREARAESDGLKNMLAALDPHRIIGAGYAAVALGGKTVTTVDRLAENDLIELVFSDGTATARIETVTKNEAV